MNQTAPLQHPPEDLLWDTVHRVRQFIRLEREALRIVASYSLGIGLFSLIVPLAVQELVNTFAIAIQPVTILTLTAIVAAALLIIATLKVHQALMVENVIQRLYTRLAVATVELLPRLKPETVPTGCTNYFLEAEFLPRALVAMLADLMNAAVSGGIGMALLVLYHPYFLLYDLVLLGGFLFLITVLGRGGFQITIAVSDLNYDLLKWFQDIALNLPHFHATNSRALLLKRTDRMTRDYVFARRTRSDILTRTQYRGAGIWQALGHAMLIGLGGWLLAIGEITLGQFVAAEVVVGALLSHMDTVARRMYALYYGFTSLRQLSRLFSLPKEPAADSLRLSLPDVGERAGLHVACRNVAFAENDGPPLFQKVDVDVEAGEKVAIFTNTSTGKTALARILAGVYSPTQGVVRYNDVDLRYLSLIPSSRPCARPSSNGSARRKNPGR
ncbi:ATP-binding cassette domain-containing protein [Candidatus Nitrospira bockiana]